jgi:energy-coupling factor transporter ATP-binding protein EcfA2
MRANLPNKTWFVDKPLPTRPDLIIKQFIGSGNDAHVFRATSAELQRDFACKVIPRANLAGVPEGKPRWRLEVEKANSLQSPVVVRFADIKEWIDDTQGIDCVVLISDFVTGENLRDFLANNRRKISMSFVRHYLDTILDLFHEMNVRRMMHGDFHAGNVLVEDRSYALVGPRHVFRVTDFGVANATSDARFKDDYLQLAVVLQQLLEEVDYGSSSSRDKYLFNALNNQFLARHLLEANPTLDPLAKNPKGLFERLQEFDREFEKLGSESPQLVTPFDFLSCEQIGDAPSLLKALYSDLFLGLREIESKNNVVVTGPRGCGKSTVFKNLSLRQKLRVNEATPDTTSYIGIYYRCDDLYFAFPRYQLPERTEALDLPVHFVTATLVNELLGALEAWATTHFADEFRQNEALASRRLWEALRCEPPKQPGIETFRAIASDLQKQRKRAAEKQRFAHDQKRPVGVCFGVDVLQRVCTSLADTFSFLRNRPIYFFIDDYSSPKVTKALQENLNRIFMQRTPVCFFKLSTESPVSFSKSDIDQKIYVETREFSLHNLGLVFLHAELGAKLEFIEDVFRRRLSAPANGYPVKELAQLLGTNASQNSNDDARQLREGKKPELWGKETLCRLCSGDIHYLISLVREMVGLAGGAEELAKKAITPRIPPRLQNKAIREAAGVFLKNLRSIPRNGDQLVAIVTAFGNVAHSFLKFRTSQNEAGNPPHQASRIEPYEPFTFSEPAQRLYEELLRYSVFIEDFRGKSRRGKVVPRLFLRRFLIPHFNLTFSTRDSVELEPDEFERFLLEPSTFEDSLRLKGPDEDSSRQIKLPFDPGEGKI